MKNDIMRSVLRGIALVMCVLAIYFLHANAYKLWYDESLTLSLAHGSNPVTLQPYTYGAGVERVIALNQQYILDPGGYTVFLAMLSPLVKNNFFIYRIINELAYVTGALLVLLMLFRPAGGIRSSYLVLGVAAYLLVILLSRSFLERLLGVSGEGLESVMRVLPFYMLVRNALFIRPYGFEVLFIALLLFLGPWYRQKGLRAAIAPVMVFFFGILMTRYDFLIFTPCYAAAVAAHEWREGRFPSLFKTRAVWLVSLAVLVGAAIVYVFGYSRQIGASTPESLGYISKYYLTGYSTLLYFLGEPKNVLACVMLLGVVVRLLRRSAGFLEIAFASVFLCYLSLSVMSFHPFSFTLQHCIAMIVLMDALVLKWLADLLTIPRLADSQLGRGVRLVSARSLPWLWLPVLLLSMRVVFREFGSKGQDAMRVTMVSDIEWGATKFNRDVDSVIRSMPGSTVYLDYMVTANTNSYYTLTAGHMPRGRFVCEPMTRFYEMNNSKPGVAERIETAVQSHCEILYIPELDISKSVSPTIQRRGYKEVFPSLFIRQRRTVP
jgi:hypothetical protein